MRTTGRIKFWKQGTGQGTGYGFATADGVEGDVFVHIADVHATPDEIAVGAAVEFDVEDGPKGPRARRVRLV